jgi:short subunit dehydrogenase-like uncharacterized protein
LTIVDQQKRRKTQNFHQQPVDQQFVDQSTKKFLNFFLLIDNFVIVDEIVDEIVAQIVARFVARFVDRNVDRIVDRFVDRLLRGIVDEIVDRNC